MNDLIGDIPRREVKEILLKIAKMLNWGEDDFYENSPFCVKCPFKLRDLFTTWGICNKNVNN